MGDKQKRLKVSAERKCSNKVCFFFISVNLFVSRILCTAHIEYTQNVSDRFRIKNCVRVMTLSFKLLKFFPTHNRPSFSFSQKKKTFVFYPFRQRFYRSVNGWNLITFYPGTTQLGGGREIKYPTNFGNIFIWIKIHLIVLKIIESFLSA